MGDESHGVVGISIEGQFYDANYLLAGGIGQVLVLVIVFLVSRVQH